MYDKFIKNLILESGMQPMQEASFGIDSYEPPKDKEDMMMDFYYLSGIHTLLPDQLHGDLAKDLESASEFALNKIVNHVQEDLAEATFFAVCAEIRHVFDRNKYDEIIRYIKENPTGTESVKIRTVKKDVDDFKVDVPWDITPTKKFTKMFTEYANLMAGAERFGTTPSRSRLEKLGATKVGKGSSSDYVKSYKAAIKASGGDKLAFAEMCKFLYIYADWATSYGGDAWAAIAHFYINVMNAKTLQDKIHTIDMLFSLQHNTGTVLNKVRNYAKSTSGHGWIAKALDFKFEVRNFAEYTNKVSPQLKQLTQAANKAINDAKEKEQVDDDLINALKKGGGYKVGDELQHKDLGYLREPLVVKRALKQYDKEYGQLYVVKNPETGKNFKAWYTDLEKFDVTKKNTTKTDLDYYYRDLTKTEGLVSLIKYPEDGSGKELERTRGYLKDIKSLSEGDIVVVTDGDEAYRGKVGEVKSIKNGEAIITFSNSWDSDEAQDVDFTVSQVEFYFKKFEPIKKSNSSEKESSFGVFQKIKELNNVIISQDFNFVNLNGEIYDIEKSGMNDIEKGSFVVQPSKGVGNDYIGYAKDTNEILWWDIDENGQPTNDELVSNYFSYIVKGFGEEEKQKSSPKINWNEIKDAKFEEIFLYFDKNIIEIKGTKYKLKKISDNKGLKDGDVVFEDEDGELGIIKLENDESIPRVRWQGLDNYDIFDDNNFIYDYVYKVVPNEDSEDVAKEYDNTFEKAKEGGQIGTVSKPYDKQTIEYEGNDYIITKSNTPNDFKKGDLVVSPLTGILGKFDLKNGNSYRVDWTNGKKSIYDSNNVTKLLKLVLDDNQGKKSYNLNHNVPKKEAYDGKVIKLGNVEGTLKKFKTSDLNIEDVIVLGKEHDQGGTIAVFKGKDNEDDNSFKIYYPNFKGGAEVGIPPKELENLFLKHVPDEDPELTMRDVIDDTKELDFDEVEENAEVTINGLKGTLKKQGREKYKVGDTVVLYDGSEYGTSPVGKVKKIEGNDIQVKWAKSGSTTVPSVHVLLKFEPDSKYTNSIEDKPNGKVMLGKGALVGQTLEFDGRPHKLVKIADSDIKKGIPVFGENLLLMGNIINVDSNHVVVQWTGASGNTQGILNRVLKKNYLTPIPIESKGKNHIDDILSAFSSGKKSDEKSISDYKQSSEYFDVGDKVKIDSENAEDIYSVIKDEVANTEDYRDFIFNEKVGTVASFDKAENEYKVEYVNDDGDKKTVHFQADELEKSEDGDGYTNKLTHQGGGKFRLEKQAEEGQTFTYTDVPSTLVPFESIEDMKSGTFLFAKKAKVLGTLESDIEDEDDTGYIKWIGYDASQGVSIESLKEHYLRMIPIDSAKDNEPNSIDKFKKGDKVKFNSEDDNVKSNYMQALRDEGVDGDIDTYADFVYNDLVGTVKKIFKSAYDVVVTFESSADGEQREIKLDPVAIKKVEDNGNKFKVGDKATFDSKTYGSFSKKEEWLDEYKEKNFSEHPNPKEYNKVDSFVMGSKIGDVVKVDGDNVSVEVWDKEGLGREVVTLNQDVLLKWETKNTTKKEELEEEATNTKGYVFDFDDTLVETKAKIKVIEHGQIMKELTPQEFNTYKLPEGHSFDFSDFDEPKYVLGAKKYKMWKTLENIDKAINRGNSTSRIYILTARNSVIKDAMMQFFKNKGIKNIDPKNIYTVGDMGEGSIAARKKLVLRAIKNNHKGKVTFYDDDEKNINLAKPEVDAVYQVQGLFESILDEPKENLDPLVWQSGDKPEIKPSVKKTIMKRLKKLMGKLPVYKVYIVGSITGKRWNEISDIDVTVIGDMNDEQQQEMVGKLKDHNEIDLEGTKHPVNFYVANKDLAFNRFDSVYDLLHDTWLKDPKDYGVDLSAYYDQFKSIMSGIAQDKSEAIRSLVDIELLEKAVKLGGNPKIITRKIMNRIGNLDAAISKLSDTYGEIHKDRVDAFLRYEQMTPEEKIQIPSPNLLPENVRYKVLERYNYLDILHKIYNFTKDSGKIDTPQEVREIKSILGIEDSITECINFLLEGDYSNEVFSPEEIYNTYYATYLNQMYPDLDLDYEANQLKDYYLNTFYDVVRTQIKKYEGRGRVASNFNKDDIESDNYDTLNDLMKKTFRSDMTRLNKRWIELTTHLAELANTRGTNKILLKLDRINNTIHNTGEKMFTKFANAEELLRAYDDAHTLSPKELKAKVTNRGLKKAARMFGESIDKGRDLFEKSLKNWNDKATGKKKSGKQPEEQQKEIKEMNEEPSFEYTGGKRRKVNKSRDGYRQDSGAGNKSTKRRVSYREQMKRELGGIKSNIKTKMRGKQAAGDAKKIVGQILNPNSDNSGGRQKVIAESWYKAFKNRKNKTVDVFMNPAKKDLKREGKDYDEVRGFIHGNNLFIWDAMKATHGEVAENIQTNQKEAIPVLLFLTKDGSIGAIQVTDFSKRGNWFRNPNTKDAILKNKYIKMNVDKQSMQDEDFISYFDDAIVGAWDEIDEGKVGTANVLEALNVSSIPKDKRDEVLANKAASKKIGSEKLGKLQKQKDRVSAINKGDWHKLSPEQKKKDLQAKGLIGGKEQELQSDGYNILIGDVNPDYFFEKPASQTFYYLRDTKKFLLGGLINHGQLAKDDNVGKKELVTAMTRGDIEWIIDDHKKNHPDSMEMEVDDIRDPYGQDVHDIADSISASLRYPTPMDAYYGGRYGVTMDSVPSISLWQEVDIDEAVEIAKDFTKKTGQKVINIYMPSSGLN